jgi:hypothetical protein
MRHEGIQEYFSDNLKSIFIKASVNLKTTKMRSYSAISILLLVVMPSKKVRTPSASTNRLLPQGKSQLVISFSS